MLLPSPDARRRGGHRAPEAVIDAEAEQRASWSQFVRHFMEMVVAMALGMAVLGIAVRLMLTQLGQASLLDQTAASVLIMSTNMTIGMAVLMRYRGHGWLSVAEMGAAMYVPFLVLLVPFWLGGLPGMAVMAGGHVLMLPCMLLVMLRRRDEYSRDHRQHQRTPAAG